MEEIICLKLLIVGDQSVGKSSMMIRYVTGTFDSEYTPTVVMDHCVKKLVDGKPVVIGMWNINGQQEFPKLRAMSYFCTDVFFICFAIENRSSFESVSSKWYPEISLDYPNVPVVLVGCKKDLRAHGRDIGMVTYEEGATLAKSLGAVYRENSSLTQEGLTNCFEDAVRVYLARRDVGAMKKKKKGLFSFGKSKKPQNTFDMFPPLTPLAEPPPLVTIETSTFGDDLYKILQEHKYCDVTFILEGTHRLDAHTIVLCSASEVFSKIFGISKPNSEISHGHAVKNYTFEYLNSGAVPGVVAVYNRHEQREETIPGYQHITVEISEDISAKHFLHILECLYSGVPKLLDADDFSYENINELDRVAEVFELNKLQTICYNIRTDQMSTIESIGTYMIDKTGANMKELFFNKADMADVEFIVEGKSVYAHKSVLCARCDVMATMFGGNFIESKAGKTEVKIPTTTENCFLAFLEYLYTDHFPEEVTDPVGLLVLADAYGQSRLLSFCEFYITKEIENTATNAKKLEIDVIGLLLMAQAHNAKQLCSWCLHFIASNYTAFQKWEEFLQLEGENKRYVEENRWPPISHLEDANVHKKLVQKVDDDEKCNIM